MLDLSRELCNKIVDGMLVCPICKSRMSVSDDLRSLICTGELDGLRRHCFDGGAGGYVSLCRNGGGGDSKDAVRARSGFLGAGYYSPAADALVETVAEYVKHDSLVIDAGCGEGYYSNRIVSAGYYLFGADLSKFAVDSAAKAARRERLSSNTEAVQSRTAYAVASVFELPLSDGCADCVVNMFAPCAPEEYARVLKDDGILIVGGAGERHLVGLKQVLYDDVYLNDERHDLPNESDGIFELVEKREVRFEITVTGRGDIDALFSMTPYYWRTSRDGRERLAACERLVTEVAFDLSVYRKKKRNDI